MCARVCGRAPECLGYWLNLELTWQGHDFLDNTRDSFLAQGRNLLV